MVTRVFFTFFRTGVASFGAQDHEIAREIRPTSIKSSAKRTDIGAVAAKLNAGRHVVAFAVAVVHFQTGCRASFAGFSAVKAGIYVAVGVLCGFHNCCS